MLRDPPWRRQTASVKEVVMLEQKTRGDNDKGQRTVGNPREYRGRDESTRAACVLRKTEFENELRQSINTTLFWYDYLSRFPKK